jgi:hypothetical protein
MVSIFSLYVVPIFTGIIIVGGILWVLFLFCYWLPKYLGLGRWILKRKILYKFRKGFEYDDDTINLCKTAIIRGWQFKDMMRLTKRSPHRKEILYTFLMMTKIKNEWYDPTQYHDKLKSDSKFLEEFVKKVK